jgi:hypothetical protein
MQRTQVISLFALIVAVPAAGAGSFFAATPQPCFMTGGGAYRFSAAADANYTVRFDNNAARPDLRMQLVDDAAAADFVLVDDGKPADACRSATAVKSIRVDAAADKTDSKPDMTVTLSKQAAASEYKIYVRSAKFTEQDAAALFAVIWQSARKTDAAHDSIAQR